MCCYRWGLPLFTLIVSSLGNASGILGTTKKLSQTDFCKAYHCQIKETVKLENGYFRNHLILPQIEGYDGLDIFELSRNEKVVAVRWEVFFQDMFLTVENSKMVENLSKAVLGLALPNSAVRTLFNNSTSGNYDPVKSSFSSGNLLAQASSRQVGNGNQFNLTLTSKTERLDLSKVDPPRIVMNDKDRIELRRRIIEALGFYRDAPDCEHENKDVPIAFPLGSDLTEEKAYKILKDIGLQRGPGFFINSPFEGSLIRIFLHSNEREICVNM